MNSPELSIFDIFKIGIGPSSSHTMGPWVAARQFLSELRSFQNIQQINQIKVELTGSLAKTGKGHATDMGVCLGLLDLIPSTIDPTQIESYLSELEQKKILPLQSQSGSGVLHSIPFNSKNDIIFNYTKILPYHPNGIIFSAFDEHQKLLLEKTYFSIGGGFIEEESVSHNPSTGLSLDPSPYPIHHGADIVKWVEKTGLSMDEIVWKNEVSWRSEKEVDQFIMQIMNTMLDSIYQGCHTEGILPGGLKVRRRAFDMCQRMINESHSNKKSFTANLKKLLFTKSNKNNPLKHREKMIKKWFKLVVNKKKFDNIINWVICFALAVNETNAASGKIVTAPTNGAAGVIPAVFCYFYFLQDGKKSFEQVRKFFLVASIIGILFKKNATISAAAGGCQAEIGVSSAMAAGALTAVNGGSVKRILMAAEIAMEHHLGMTCDPIGGLVQVPCIERNSMGSIKAITASQIALTSDPDHAVVEIDDIIKTMWETAQDMNNKYKETAEGGLATNVGKRNTNITHISVNLPEC